MRHAPALLLLALAACGRGEQQPQDLAGLDRALTEAARNGPDPAVTAALNDQIMLDPTLAQQSNADAVMPPPRPDPGSVPVEPPLADPVAEAGLRHAPPPAGGCPECRRPALTLGALAARAPLPRAGRCANVGYSFTWANRLPAGLPLYPAARVVEAAGNDAGGCALRVVSFASAAAPAKLIDWYFTRTAAAGHSAGQRADGDTRLLGGARGDAAYLLSVTPRPGGGADADLIVSGG